MSRTIFIFFASIFFCFAGCGSPEPQGSSDTGEIAFSVNWQDALASHAPAFESAAALASSLDCTTNGVDTVTALAYSISDMFLASGGPWNCSDHSGTIDNVPAQSNIKVIILAKDGLNNVRYRGEQPGLTVTAGQTTSAGTITARYFPPTLAAPANSATVSNGFSFSWTSTGVSYEIQVSSEDGFTSTVIDAQGIATMYTPSSMNAGNYYWRVKAFDSHAVASAWSEVWSFTISGVPTSR
jgi:hypothetical protein